MNEALTILVGMFTTLLAVINPLEAIPIFLKLMDGKSEEQHRKVARLSCTYALLLMFFFLVFGTLLLRAFGVPLSMVRIVGGIILMRIGFQLFSPSSSSMVLADTTSNSDGEGKDVAFVPLAMPIMFGPGAIATVLGMTSVIKHSELELLSFAAVCVAFVATMVVTFLSLIYAKRILGKIGPKGIDAATRIVGFFVSAMGMGLIFHGLIEALRTYIGGGGM